MTNAQEIVVLDALTALDAMEMIADENETVDRAIERAEEIKAGAAELDSLSCVELRAHAWATVQRIAARNNIPMSRLLR